MKSIFYGRLEAKIQEKIEMESGWITDGGPATIEGYKLVVGVIKGLRDALELAKEVDAEQMGMSHASGPSKTGN